MATASRDVELNWEAQQFALPATDGEIRSLEAEKGEKGTVVVFICNHCPYVLAILDRLIEDARALQAIGVNLIAINSNDPVSYPQDSFENMIKLAQEKGFPFPYLFDESQEIARAYDAQCTPDFFGFDADLKLQYRGRIDASRPGAHDSEAKRELYDAMLQIAQTGKGPEEQNASMGCSIKWR